MPILNSEEVIPLDSPQPIPASNRLSGYLSPGGDFYSIYATGHVWLAKRIMENLYPGVPLYSWVDESDDEYDPQSFLDREGWIKISDDDVYFFGENDRGSTTATPIQIELLSTWYEKANPGPIFFNSDRVYTLEELLRELQPA